MVMVPALMVPVVWSSSVLRTDATRVVSERVTASLAKPVIPDES